MLGLYEALIAQRQQTAWKPLILRANLEFPGSWRFAMSEVLLAILSGLQTVEDMVEAFGDEGFAADCLRPGCGRPPEFIPRVVIGAGMHWLVVTEANSGHVWGSTRGHLKVCSPTHANSEKPEQRPKAYAKVGHFPGRPLQDETCALLRPSPKTLKTRPLFAVNGLT